MMITVVVPVYNSEHTLRLLCEKIVKVMGAHQHDYEIILVDDGSQDDSPSIMRALATSNRSIIAIRLSENSGQQNALLCGIRHSHGDYVVTIDDDLQQEPEDIIPMLYKLQGGYDVVYGVGRRIEVSTHRRLGTWLKEYMFTAILGKPEGVQLTSFRIMNRATALKVMEDTRSRVYLSAAILSSTRRIGNIPVAYYRRLHGQSGYSFGKLVRLMGYILVYYAKLPLLKRFRQEGEQYRIQEVIGGRI